MWPDFPRRDRLQDTRKQLVQVGTILGCDLYVELKGDPDKKECELAMIQEILRRTFIPEEGYSHVEGSTPERPKTEPTSGRSLGSPEWSRKPSSSPEHPEAVAHWRIAHPTPHVRSLDAWHRGSRRI